MLRNLNVNIVNNTPARSGDNKSSSILKTPAATNNNQQQRSFFGVFSSASLSQEDLKSPLNAIKKEVLLATGEKQQKGLGRRSSSVPLSFEVPRHASVKKELFTPLKIDFDELLLHDDTPDGESSCDDGLDYPGDFRATYLPLSDTYEGTFARERPLSAKFWESWGGQMIMPEDFFAVDESLPIDWESGMELVSGEEKRRQDELTGPNRIPLPGYFPGGYVGDTDTDEDDSGCFSDETNGPKKKHHHPVSMLMDDGRKEEYPPLATQPMSDHEDEEGEEPAAEWCEGIRNGRKNDGHQGTARDFCITPPPPK